MSERKVIKRIFKRISNVFNESNIMHACVYVSLFMNEFRRYFFVKEIFANNIFFFSRTSIKFFFLKRALSTRNT